MSDKKGEEPKKSTLHSVLEAGENVLSHFWEISSKPDSQPPNPTGPQASQPASQPAPPPVNAAGPVSGSPSPEVLEWVKKLKASALAEESEYVRFVRAEEALRSVVPDKAMREKAAMVTLKSTGASIQSAIDQHLAKLKIERAAFQKKLEDLRNLNVVAPQKKADEIAAKVADLAAQQTKIEEEMNRLTVERLGVVKTARENEARIQAAQSAFDAALAMVEGEFDSAKAISRQ